MPFRLLICPWIILICKTAWLTSPVPASPLVLIIAAPSLIRLRASPKFRAPQTKGIVNLVFSMWNWSAGVRTSDSSTISTPRASKIWASAKCPILALAIKGMVTALMICSIMAGSAILATPPIFLISAGTAWSAMTATAPACSAITACSDVVTSMITPPFCILAKPRLSSSVPNLKFSSSSAIKLPLASFAASKLGVRNC